MAFPVVTPSFYKELVDVNKAEYEDDGFSEVIYSPAAVEYVLHINEPKVVSKLISEDKPLSFIVGYADGDMEIEMRNSCPDEMMNNPFSGCYWQLRELMMGVLQNRNVSFEERMLLLNYALKSVQGMMDQHHPELIPKFISDYTDGSISYGEVLKFFNGIAVNPPYALTDGISLLKSVVKYDRGYKDVMNTVYKNLGVSGPETLNVIDMKKYLEMRKDYSDKFMREHSGRMENIMVNLVWEYSIPFACGEKLNVWENFVFFNLLYNALKILITCTMPYASDDDFVKVISSFGSAMRNAGKDCVWKAVMAVKNSGQATNGDMAILTIS